MESKEFISVLLAKYQAGDCSENEKQQLYELLVAEEGENFKFFFGKDFDNIEQKEPRVPVDKEFIWENINKVLVKKENIQVVHKKPSFSWLKYAAVWGAVLLGAAFILLQGESWFGIKDEVAESGLINEVVVPKGKKKLLTLQDGSKIQLNSGSIVRYNTNFIKQPRREVYLEGEAFFEVTKNNKPFTIITGDIETTVLGTSFGIKAKPLKNKVQVSVVTGKVMVENKDKELKAILLPDKMATYDKTKNEMRVSAYDKNLILGWKEGILVFENASFEEIIELLEYWYGVEIEVDGKSDRTDLSGNYPKNTPLQTILEGLSFAADFSYEINKKEVIIKIK